MKELWKPIDNYEDNYLISNYGNVWSKINNRLLKAHQNHKGYNMVSLYSNGVKVSYSVHRLVAIAFCKGFEEGLHVHHIDSVKLNNRSDNLMWVTNYENYLYSVEEGSHPSLHQCKAVNQLSKEGEFIKQFKSLKQAGRDLGIAYTNIGTVCRKLRGTAGGFKWEYAINDEGVFLSDL